MTTTDVRVGVRLPPVPERLGEWLGVASAFDAAGADSLWVELDLEAGLDPLTMVAALAVATSRSRLVLCVDAADLATGEWVRVIDTVRRLSHDRLTLLAPAERREEILAVVPGVPLLISRGPLSGGSDDVETVVAEGRTDEGVTERWLAVATPEGRESWAETWVRAAAREAAGVVAAPDDVLLSLLRNPRPRGDRREMNIASG